MKKKKSGSNTAPLCLPTITPLKVKRLAAACGNSSADLYQLADLYSSAKKKKKKRTNSENIYFGNDFKKAKPRNKARGKSRDPSAQRVQRRVSLDALPSRLAGSSLKRGRGGVEL